MTLTTAGLLEAALSYAELGWPVVPLHTPIQGECDCPDFYKKGVLARKGGAECSSPGKHPRTIHGLDDATTDPDKIKRWWQIFPDANIGIDLNGAGLVDVAPDSIQWQAEFIARGLPRTPSFRSGGGDGHEHHFYRRPEVCPPYRLCRTDEYDVLSAGYAVMPPSLHVSGRHYAWSVTPDETQLAGAPRWAVQMLREHVRKPENGTIDFQSAESGEPPVQIAGEALERWAGRLVTLKSDGQVDRSGSLWAIGCDLAAAGAARPTIAAALQERDETLGWSKYSHRNDARTRYFVIADRVLSGEAPRIRLKHADQRQPSPASAVEGWTWKVYDIDDFMSLDIPPIQWLVDRLVREQAIVGNFGGPGTLKTYFMSQLAISIASGERFLGMYETRQSRVLIVEEDTLEADYQQAYLAPMLKAMAIKPAELRGWLAIAPPGDMLLDQPERLGALEAKIESFRPAMVCLDAFYLLHSGEGMTAKDLQPILFTLKRLRRTYGCAFWLIDHNRKSSGAAVSDEVAMDRWYGGRSKSAASDAVIETRARKDDDGAASFHVLKLRGSKLPPPVQVRLTDGKMILDESQSDQAAEGTKTLIVQWLITQASGRTLNDISLGTKLSHRHVQRAAGEMAQGGRMVKVGKTGRADLWHLAEQTAGPAMEAPWV